MPLDPERIRSRRERLHLNQEEAAQRAGMTRTGWVRIESGKRLNPNLWTAERMALALRCQLAKLLRRV